MPFNWSEQAERNMLLLAICAADLKPTSSTWAMVAERMGGGLNASAVRYTLPPLPLSLIHILPVIALTTF